MDAVVIICVFFLVQSIQIDQTNTIAHKNMVCEGSYVDKKKKEERKCQ